MFRGLLALAVSSLVMTSVADVSIAADEIRVLTFDGYTEPLWIEPFEEEHDVKVKAILVNSNDEYMAKLAASGGNGEYDVVVIASSLTQPAIRAGFVEPLNLELLTNYNEISPVLRNLDYNKHDGKAYGVCLFWGTAPTTVNSNVVPKGTGFGVLFDPAHKGKIALWDDVSTVADVANYMGYQNIWDLSDDELEAVKAKMIEQKPLLRKYWTNPGELIELFKGGEVVAANSWNYITNTLKADGYQVHEEQNDTPVAWVDDYFIAKGTENLELAHKLIDHLISAEVQAQIAEHTGYSVCNPNSKNHMDPAVWNNLHMIGMEELLGNAIFWEEIPRRAKYNEVLNEIKAAQ